MTKVKRNVVANLFGRAWTMVLAVAFIPFYLKFLGMEAYGLVGFFASLQSIFGVMDFGIGTTLNREMARYSVLEGHAREQRDLLRTLETVYWGIALSVSIMIVLLAPSIARQWMNPKQLSPEAVENAIRLMGLVMVLQFPFSFYHGGLMGMQRQVTVNAIVSLVGTFRGVGAVLVLWLVSPTIGAFFGWQVAVAAAGTLACSVALWGSMPPSGERARFRPELLRGVWRFAAFMFGNAMLGVLLTQLDKVILSRMVPLEQFGYYALAGTVASLAWSVIIPVNAAIFPRFTQLVQVKDEAGLTTLFHQGCQFLAVALLPVAVTVAFFPSELIFLWTRNATTALNASTVLAFLVAGTTLNGLASIPVYLRVASGWPQLTMYTNLAAVFVITPLTIYLVKRYGVVGGAAAWMALNSIYLLVSAPIMFRRLLRGEVWKWYLRDIALPLLVVLAAAGASRLLSGTVRPGLWTAVHLFLTWFAATILAACVLPLVRSWLFGQIAGIRKNGFRFLTAA